MIPFIYGNKLLSLDIILSTVTQSVYTKHTVVHQRVQDVRNFHLGFCA